MRNWSQFQRGAEAPKIPRCSGPSRERGLVSPSPWFLRVYNASFLQYAVLNSNTQQNVSRKLIGVHLATYPSEQRRMGDKRRKEKQSPHSSSRNHQIAVLKMQKNGLALCAINLDSDAISSNYSAACHRRTQWSKSYSVALWRCMLYPGLRIWLPK